MGQRRSWPNHDEPQKALLTLLPDEGLLYMCYVWVYAAFIASSVKKTQAGDSWTNARKTENFTKVHKYLEHGGLGEWSNEHSFLQKKWQWVQKNLIFE